MANCDWQKANIIGREDLSLVPGPGILDLMVSHAKVPGLVNATRTGNFGFLELKMVESHPQETL